MDFIVALPESQEYTKFCVIVDRFAQMAHFIPIKIQVSIMDLALIFLKNVGRLNGVLESITFDADTLFTCRFCLSLKDLLEDKVKVFTGFHPETDRQTERVNQTLEPYLCSYCSYRQDD